MTKGDLIRRFLSALQDLDIGVPASLIRRDTLGAFNKVLRKIGAPMLSDLDDLSALAAAVRRVEAAT